MERTAAFNKYQRLREIIKDIPQEQLPETEFTLYSPEASRSRGSSPELKIKGNILALAVTNIEKEIKSKQNSYALTNAKFKFYRIAPKIVLVAGSLVALNSIAFTFQSLTIGGVGNMLLNIGLSFGAYKATRAAQKEYQRYLELNHGEEEEIFYDIETDDFAVNAPSIAIEAEPLTFEEINDQVAEIKTNIWYTKLKSWGCTAACWVLPATGVATIMSQIGAIVISNGLDPNLVPYVIASIGINGAWSIYSMITTNNWLSNKKLRFEEELKKHQTTKKRLEQAILNKIPDIDLENLISLTENQGLEESLLPSHT